MKILVSLNVTSGPQPVKELEADLVFYGSDGDGSFYYHRYGRVDGQSRFDRVGGGHYGAGRWSHVEETVPAAGDLFSVWRSVQNKVVQDPEKIPRL